MVCGAVKKLKFGVKTFPLAGNRPVQGEDLVVALDWGLSDCPLVLWVKKQKARGQGVAAPCVVPAKSWPRAPPSHHV